MSSPGDYENAAQVLLRESGCTVRKWRTRNTGVAATHSHDWAIEVPHPRGPVSFATFAHEVAHQLLHRPDRGKRRPRWLEEIEATEWALAQFARFGLTGEKRARESLARHLLWMACKAERRCTPETAQRILDRYSWVWAYEVDRTGVEEEVAHHDAQG